MKSSIGTVSISGNLVEKLESITAAGFDGIEIFEQDFIAHDGHPREVGDMIRSMGLEITLFQPLGLNRRASCGNCPPALLTRMSTSCRPASASTLSRLRISTRSTVTGLPVAAVISAAAASSTSVRRAAITTVAPAAESPSAIARPRPVPPPVTSATEPASKSEANIVRRPFAGAESGAAEAAVGVSLIQPSWTPQGVIWRLR